MILDTKKCIMIRLFGLLVHYFVYIIWLSNVLSMGVPVEGYSRNYSSAQHFKSRL
jgi:hypothetical protein